MACEAEKKPVAATNGMFGGLYGGSKTYGSGGKIDRFQGWSRFNAATLNENNNRISSFSKEDSYNFSNLYNLRGTKKESKSDTTTGSKKTKEDQILSKQDTTTRHGHATKGTTTTIAPSADTPRPIRSSIESIANPKITRSQSGSAGAAASPPPVVDHQQKASSEIPSTAPPRIRHARSASSCVPPFGGFMGKSSSSQQVRGGGGPTSPPAASSVSTSGRTSLSPPMDTSLNTSGASLLKREGSGRLHRRGSSDMAGLMSENRANFSTITATNNNLSAVAEESRNSISPSSKVQNDSSQREGLTLKTGIISPVKESGNGSASSGGSSSRGSSLTGSPTVNRTSSNENLFTNGGSPTSGGSAHSRSSSGNVGNLLGAISSGSYTGGGLNTGSATPRVSTAKSTIPTVAPPTQQQGSVNGVSGYASNGKVMFGGGLISGSGAKSSMKAETPRASSMDPYAARGNIHAVGESLHIKRMLSGSDPEEVKNAGNEQYKKGNFQEALTLYDRAIILAPGKAPYRSNRAAALTGLGRLAEAVKECEEAIKLDPNYLRAHQRLASLHLRLGRIMSAKRHFRLAGQQTDVADLYRMEKIEKHVAKCFEARKNGDWDTVVMESDAAVVAGADSASQVFALKAEAFLKQRKHEEADAILLAAQKVEVALRKSTSMPADTTTLLVQAQIDMALGRFEGAVIAAEKAAHFDPKNTEVSPMLRRARAVATARTQGNDLYKAGKILEASVAYSEGLQYHPTNAILLCNRAACRSKQGHYEKAVEDCTAALDAQPNYLKALLRRANCYLKMERWDKAVRDYERLRKEMPGDLTIAQTLYEVQVALKKARGEVVDEVEHGGEVAEICSNEQLREAISQPGVAVVQFNTRWSERCRQMSTYVEQLCKLNPSINFLKVDVEENPYLAKAESVSFVPTFKIYKNGFKVKEIVGPTHQALENVVSHFSL